VKDQNQVCGAPLENLLAFNVIPKWLLNKPTSVAGLPQTRDEALAKELKRLEERSGRKTTSVMTCSLFFAGGLLLANNLPYNHFNPLIALNVIFVIIAGFAAIIHFGDFCKLSEPTELAKALRMLSKEALDGKNFHHYCLGYLSRYGGETARIEQFPQGIYMLCSMTRMEFVEASEGYLLHLATVVIHCQRENPDDCELQAKRTDDFRRAFWSLFPFVDLPKDWTEMFEKARLAYEASRAKSPTAAQSPPTKALLPS